MAGLPVFARLFKALASIFRKNELYYINGSDSLPPPLDPTTEEYMISRIDTRIITM